MKQKSIVNAEDRARFSVGFRVLKENAHEFITYPANTSIRCWHRKDEPDSYDPHFHSAVEVLLPIQGELRAVVDEQEYRILAGEVMIIPAGCLHSLTMGPGNERELILFEMNGVFSMKEFGSFRQLLSKPVYLMTDHPVREKVQGLLLEIARIYHGGELLRNLRCYALLLEMYAALGEDYLRNNATKAELNTLHRQLSGEDAFNRALDYVEANYMEDVTLDSLAAYAGFSRYTLSRMFRQQTGSTFTQYLNKRRVDMAADLLSGTKMAVTQVALQCGFNSIATFNRVFREIRGCTPTQYRMIYDETQRK